VRLPEPLLSPPPPQDGVGGTGAASGAAGEAAAAAARGELPRTPEGALLLQRHLRARWRIEVPVACVGGRLYCRISAQVSCLVAVCLLCCMRSDDGGWRGREGKNDVLRLEAAGRTG
jgi:hypothetical protein